VPYKNFPIAQNVLGDVFVYLPVVGDAEEDGLDKTITTCTLMLVETTLTSREVEILAFLQRCEFENYFVFVFIFVSFRINVVDITDFL
jgi:hypothetical protein